MAEFDDRGVIIDRGGDAGCRHEARRKAEHARDAVHDVIVGGEIAALGEDRLARGSHARRGDEQLEQVDRDGVGYGHLMRRGAEQRR